MECNSNCDCCGRFGESLTVIAIVVVDVGGEGSSNCDHCFGDSAARYGVVVGVGTVSEFASECRGRCVRRV